MSKKSVQFALRDSRLVTPWCTCLVLIGFMQGACCNGLTPMLIIALVAECKSCTLQPQQQINSSSSSSVQHVSLLLVLACLYMSMQDYFCLISQQSSFIFVLILKFSSYYLYLTNNPIKASWVGGTTPEYKINIRHLAVIRFFFSIPLHDLKSTCNLYEKSVIHIALEVTIFSLLCPTLN